MTLSRLCKCKSPKLYRFRGKHYTAREIAELTGMPLRTVRGRVRGDVVIDGRLPFGPTPKLYSFRGEQLTMRQIMDRTGFSRNKVRARLHCGRFIAYGELPDLNPDPPINARLITYAGRTLTLTEWAMELRIDRRTLRARLSRGWPIADAFTRPVAHKRPTPGGALQLSATPRGPAGGHARTITNSNEGRP